MRAQFVKTKPSTTREAITAVEAELGLRLPENYVDHLLHHNGGRPEPGTFSYLKPNGRTQRTTVAWFFSVGSYEYENLLEHCKDFDGRIPADTVPIARDPGGSLILMGVKGHRHGKVLFWDWAQEAPEGNPPWEKNVYPLADSLQAFLDMLEPL